VAAGIVKGPYIAFTSVPGRFGRSPRGSAKELICVTLLAWADALAKAQQASIAVTSAKSLVRADNGSPLPEVTPLESNRDAAGRTVAGDRPPGAYHRPA
jgi:hypothetical protein